MTLLDQRRIDELIALSEQRVARAREQVRAMMYADGHDSTPPGFVNLDTPDAVSTFSRYLSRQSSREQRNAIPGDLNRTIAEHPAVQDMAAQAAAEQQGGS